MDSHSEYIARLQKAGVSLETAEFAYQAECAKANAVKVRSDNETKVKAGVKLGPWTVSARVDIEGTAKLSIVEAGKSPIERTVMPRGEDGGFQRAVRKILFLADAYRAHTDSIEFNTKAAAEADRRLKAATERLANDRKEIATMFSDEA